MSPFFQRQRTVNTNLDDPKGEWGLVSGRSKGVLVIWDFVGNVLHLLEQRKRRFYHVKTVDLIKKDSRHRVHSLRLFSTHAYTTYVSGSNLSITLYTQTL